MEYKRKVCKGCGEMEFLWARGKCKRCSMSGKKPVTVGSKYKMVKDAEYVAMGVFWAEKVRVDECHCAECGKELGDVMNPYSVAHIISKGSNPAFRCDMRNFVLLCPMHHDMFDGQVDGKCRSDMKVWGMTERVRMELHGVDDV